MKKRHPAISALLCLGYFIAGILVFGILSVAVVIAFFNQSDEAWNGIFWIVAPVTVFALPLGILLAIGTYFRERLAATGVPAEKKPQVPTHGSA